MKRGKQNDEKCKTSIYNDVVVDNGFATLATLAQWNGEWVRLTNLNQLTDYNARFRCARCDISIFLCLWYLRLKRCDNIQLLPIAGHLTHTFDCDWPSLCHEYGMCLLYQHRRRRRRWSPPSAHRNLALFCIFYICILYVHEQTTEYIRFVYRFTLCSTRKR